MMSMTLYQDIIKTIQMTKLRECQNVLEQKYPTIPIVTLGSILSNYTQKLMKMNHGRHNNAEKIQEYYHRYKKAIANNEENIILRISDDISITPVLVAKFVLEGFLLEQQEIRRREQETEALADTLLNDDESKFSESDKLVSKERPPFRPISRNEIKAEITRFLRDTSSIPDRNLAYEVHLCTVHDDNYGPLPDAIKRTIGKEYEVKLSKLLQEQGILYLDEDVLRKQGYDKTPDFKLEAPIAIDNKIITWIECKATFGDEETHKNYVKDQLTSYYNRFGPGLVIYWLGYVETIQESKSKGIFVCDHLPTSITKFDPTFS